MPELDLTMRNILVFFGLALMVILFIASIVYDEREKARQREERANRPKLCEFCNKADGALLEHRYDLSAMEYIMWTEHFYHRECLKVALEHIDDYPPFTRSWMLEVGEQLARAASLAKKL